jgi:hypothetical protein
MVLLTTVAATLEKGNTPTMRTTIAALSASLLLAGAALAAGQSGPTLSIGKTATGLTAIQGRHFRPHTSVRVLFVAGRNQSRTVRTGGTGSFMTALPLPYDPCTGMTVSAADGIGNTAILKLPRRECMPAAAP